MFHCNGWCYTWAVTAMGARHRCLPALRPGGGLGDADARARAHATSAARRPCSSCSWPRTRAPPVSGPRCALFVGGAPPSPALLHVRASSACRHPPLRPHRDVRADRCVRVAPGVGSAGCRRAHDRADGAPGRRHARRASRCASSTRAMADVPRTARRWARSSCTATTSCSATTATRRRPPRPFPGGWFRSGDLGVMHPDGYIEIRDRLKDMIISGGENIATSRSSRRSRPTRRCSRWPSSRAATSSGARCRSPS